MGEAAGQCAVEVHTMHDEPFVRCVWGQACGSLRVVDRLGNMYVHAHVQRCGQVCGRGDGFIAAGECGMESDHAGLARADVTLALLETALGTFRHRGKRGYLLVQRVVVAPAIRCSVARAHTNPYLAAGAVDRLQRSLDGAGRFMVIHDAGGSRQYCLDCTEFCRPVDGVEVEGSIEAPPYEFEHVGETCGDASRCRHASSHGGVQVVVGVDQTGCHAEHVCSVCGDGVHSSSPTRRIGSVVRH